MRFCIERSLKLAYLSRGHWSARRASGLAQTRALEALAVLRTRPAIYDAEAAFERSSVVQDIQLSFAEL